VIVWAVGEILDIFFFMFLCFFVFVLGWLGMSGELFSVYQTFRDGSQEKVREFVPAEEAVAAAEHYCSSVGARMGFTVDVKIVDMLDCCCFHWRHGEGVVFPVPAESESI